MMDNTTAMTTLNGYELTSKDLDVVAADTQAPIPKAMRSRGALYLIREYTSLHQMSIVEFTKNYDIIDSKVTPKSRTLRANLIKSGYIIPPLDYVWERDDNGNATGCAVKYVLARDGKEHIGPKVTLKMAEADGWTRNPKWKTIPEQMLMNRATTFLVNYYFPDVSDGQTSDEAEDIMYMNQAQEQEYEDKTEPEPEPVKVKSPRVKLSERALSECGGDREAATKLCVESLNRVGISSAELTEENLPKAIQAMIGILAEANTTMTKPETETEAETDDAPF